MGFLLLLGTINSNLIFLQIKNININKKWHQSVSHSAALKSTRATDFSSYKHLSTVVIESLGSPPSLKQTKTFLGIVPNNLHHGAGSYA